MRYLCLIYSDEKRIGALPETEMGELMGEYNSFTQEVRESGHFLGGERLQPTHAATTVRNRNGRVSATDGPFAETKEQLGGFYMIEATDLNDAVRVASRIPSAREGSIEVRPIWETDPQ